MESIINNIYFEKSITEYLRWYEIMPLLLINKLFSKNIEHPYIKYAIKYYKNKDGLSITRLDAIEILKITKLQLASELVETAILENYDRLNTFKNFNFENVNKILSYDYSEVEPIFEEADKEIELAITKSRCSLYTVQENVPSYSQFKSLDISDIIYTYPTQFEINTTFNKVIYGDSQVELIISKTNIPINYQYIFLYRFLLLRRRYQSQNLLF